MESEDFFLSANFRKSVTQALVSEAGSRFFSFYGIAWLLRDLLGNKLITLGFLQSCGELKEALAQRYREYREEKKWYGRGSAKGIKKIKEWKLIE